MLEIHLKIYLNTSIKLTVGKATALRTGMYLGLVHPDVLKV